MANFTEKQNENIFLKIAKYLFPWKGDSVVELIRKIIFLAATVVLAVSVISLIVSACNRAADTQNNNDLSDLYHGNTTGNAVVELDTDRREELEKEYPEVMDKFLPLLEINEDVVGWVTIGDPESPVIDYVVVQGEDNDFYLSHNYKKEKSVSGSIFADAREPLTIDSEPANIILYGHNMRSGEYFAKLTRYFNYKPSGNVGLDFYKKYPTVTFSTLYENRTYKIFGGMLVNTRSKHGKVFDYLGRRNFSSKEDFDSYIADILDRSTFLNPDVNLKYGDNLLTMSTCIYDYGDSLSLRWVVFAREVREGESPEVDVSQCYENPDPLYFDYYYNTYGGSWGGRKWPAEMIQGFSY